MEKKDFKGWLYLLPALLFLGAFLVYPLIDVFVYSFEEGYNSASQTYYGTGIYNYSYVLHDPYFLQALKNTLLLVAITVPVSTLLALLISVALSSVKPLRKLYQTVYFLPYVTNTLAIGLVFMILFKKTAYTDGLINLVLNWFGGESVDFIDGPYWAKMLVLCCVHGLGGYALQDSDSHERSGFCEPELITMRPGWTAPRKFRIFYQNHAADDLADCVLSSDHRLHRSLQGLQRCCGALWHEPQCGGHEYDRRLCLRHALRRQRRLSVLCLRGGNHPVCHRPDHHLHQPAGQPETRSLYQMRTMKNGL